MIVLIALVVLLAYVLKHTAWGRHVYAVGDDPDAAELSGVNVKGTLISVYAFAVLFAPLPVGPLSDELARFRRLPDNCSISNQ